MRAQLHLLLLMRCDLCFVGRYHLPEPEEHSRSNYNINIIRKCLTVKYGIHFQLTPSSYASSLWAHDSVNTVRESDRMWVKYWITFRCDLFLFDLRGEHALTNCGCKFSCAAQQWNDSLKGGAGGPIGADLLDDPNNSDDDGRERRKEKKVSTPSRKGAAKKPAPGMPVGFTSTETAVQ